MTNDTGCAAEHLVDKVAGTAAKLVLGRVAGLSAVLAGQAAGIAGSWFE